MPRTHVVTYQAAYLSHVEIDVCSAHAADTPEARAARDAAEIPALGPVSVGGHRGVCEVCIAVPRRDGGAR